VSEYRVPRKFRVDTARRLDHIVFIEN
jgi:hypothetical protein